MAAIASVVVQNFYSETLRAIRKSNPGQLLLKAQQGGSPENLLAARMIADPQAPDFIVTGTTDTNTADSDAINLSAQGVTFPDAAHRLIRIDAWAADEDGVGFVRHLAIIDGGATPIVADQIGDANLDDGVAAAFTLDVEVATNQVIIEAVGASSDNLRWYIEVYVGDLIPIPYLA
jgi:hypothetical protein